ncbi:hypothetical protein E8E12_001902 [Didymella heteroderae]|uniref:Isochorismatase-like domain-containing protein n=1 Tax=Didymella heteroderae TaxID=1769908 RepID=A0A9P4WH55_9PLEO|nr:hypothetical protein E8E12_001902 [Didymella heteroderae]
MTTASANSSMFDTSDPAAPGHYASLQTALLLLDFHRMFIEKAGGPRAPAALQVAASLRYWAKSHGIHVIHCLIDVHGTPYPTCKGFARLGGLVAAMAKDGGDEPKELTKDCDDNERTFTRRPGYVSALKSPGLGDYLQSQGIKSLILGGLSTTGCVLRTALAACDAEYVTTVVSDGCADGGEGLHDLALKVVESRGYVATAVELREGYGKAKDSKTQ